jgi:hypothetical protein
MVPARRALLHPEVIPEAPAVVESTERVGWRWRLQMAAAALGGSRPAIRSASEALFPPPAPTPPPALPKPDSRVFVACAPFAAANPLHCYRPPFGLHMYDPRFNVAAARAA